MYDTAVSLSYSKHPSTLFEDHETTLIVTYWYTDKRKIVHAHRKKNPRAKTGYGG